MNILRCKRRRDAFRKRRSSVNRSGAAVVEFAVVAPLMMMLTLGLMEVSRIVMVKQLLVNASREGARLAILPETTSEEVQSQVVADLQAASVNGVTVSISPQLLSTATAGTPVTVSASVSAADVSWIPHPVYSFNTTLVGSTTMRKESQ